jgi:hypothetical protein
VTSANNKKKNYENEEDGPRVFEEGALTLVIGPDKTNVYVGSICLKRVDAIKIEESIVSISLDKKKNSKHDQEIEDSLRLVKTLPWVKLT